MLLAADEDAKLPFEPTESVGDGGASLEVSVDIGVGR